MKQSASDLDVLTRDSWSIISMEDAFSKALLTAEAIQRFKEALSPAVMAPVMKLQNSPLGFRTDKSYSEEVVKENLICALINGLMPCGNHFNIIAGRMYITKEGFTFLLRKAGVPYSIDYSVPKTLAQGNGAIVSATIHYTLNDKPEKKQMDIPVKLNAGMGVDAALGKADRKAKCWLYNHIMNTSLSDADVDSHEPVRDVPSSQGRLALSPKPVVEVSDDDQLPM